MAALIAPSICIHQDRFECENGWYRLAFHEEPSDALPEIFGFDTKAAGYRIARFQAKSSCAHYAIFRGTSFEVEAGDSPSDEALERSAYWNDCLLLSFDRFRRTWQILSNRAASIPVFWKSDNGRTLVSNDMAWLGGRSGPLDEVALAETILWDVPFRARTLRKSIHQLPAGYKLLVSHSGTRTQRAFTLNIRPSRVDGSRVDFEELAIQGALLNARAVQRAVSKDGVLILPISGGLDSRCILGSLEKEMLSRCDTVSFGQPGALEIRFGRAVAARCGVPWRSYELNDAHYTANDLAESVRTGCGMTPLQHLHLSSALQPYARGQFQVLIGFMGDPVAGADSVVGGRDTGAVALMFRNAGFTLRAAIELFGRQTIEGIVGDIESIYRDATLENPREAFHEYYFIVERQSKLITHIFNHLHLSEHSLGFPFMDGGWARFFLSLPPELRANRTLFKRALSVQRPDLERIPNTADFGSIAGSRLLRSGTSLLAKNWNRACTLSQRLSGYRYSLSNPFATELQGIVLGGPLHRRLHISIETLHESGLISAALAEFLGGRRSFQHAWSGFRAISAARCLEEDTL